MRRDMNLVRGIMLRIEAAPGHVNTDEMVTANHPAGVIAYHVKLLVDGGYLEAQDVSGFGKPEWIITGLKWNGHQFLDAARDDTIWRKVTRRIGDALGSASLDMVMEMLKDEMKRSLGLGS